MVTTVAARETTGSHRIERRVSICERVVSQLTGWRASGFLARRQSWSDSLEKILGP